MANLYFHNPQTNERSLKAMHLKLAIGAAGAVTLSRGINVVSAAKTGVGEITITLPKFASFVGAKCILEAAAAVDDSYQVKSVDSEAGTLVLMTKVAGVAADLASGSILHIELLYKNTSVAN